MILQSIDYSKHLGLPYNAGGQIETHHTYQPNEIIFLYNKNKNIYKHYIKIVTQVTEQLEIARKSFQEPETPNIKKKLR